jgi:hypothetical protein
MKLLFNVERLKSISGFFLILGYLLIVMTIVISIVIFIGINQIAPSVKGYFLIPLLLLPPLLGLIFSIPYFAVGELIGLLMQIEKNTRTGKTLTENPVGNSPELDKGSSSAKEWLLKNPEKNLRDYFAQRE